MTQEEKASAYDEALALMKDCIPDEDGYVCVRPCDIFQELKESEDEKIRKALVKAVSRNLKGNKLLGTNVTREEALAWLEKQGEQKPIDKVEPKFHESDWVLNDVCFPVQITSIKDGMYIFTEGDAMSVSFVDENYHLWSIADAKDGDILAYVTDEEDLWIMIYQSLYEPYEGHVHYHALLVNDNFSDKGTCCICIDDLKPATKEQRDLLFAKMHEEGWEWDAEKKEVKKIEAFPILSNSSKVGKNETKNGTMTQEDKDYLVWRCKTN